MDGKGGVCEWKRAGDIYCTLRGEPFTLARGESKIIQLSGASHSGRYFYVTPTQMGLGRGG